MDIDSLLDKYQINLDRATYEACRTGIELVHNGTDPHHDDNHIFMIFNHLDCLLESSPRLRQQIHFPVLLPAICWHDVWVSKHQARDLLHLMYLQVVEGKKSAQMWYAYSKNKLNPKQVTEVGYCIKKHSSLQFLPPLSLEAKILIDLDKLDSWNIDRFFNSQCSFVSKKELYSWRVVRIYYTYSGFAGLYFRELQERFDILRNHFWTEVI